VHPFGCVNFAAIGMESNQGRGIFKTGPTVCRFLAYGKGFIVATERLEDCRALAICDVGVDQESIGTIDVLESIGEQMEAAPGARTCDKRDSLGGDADELLRHLCCLLVIGNAAEDEPAKRDQLDEANSTFNGGVTAADVRLQAIDLRPKIRQRNRPVRDRQRGDRVQTGGVCCGPHDEPASGRFGRAM
jgi:hypothetical protein